MNAPASTLHELIRSGAQRPFWRRLSFWGGLLLLIALGLGVWFWQQQRSKDALPRYTTEPVVRGNLVVRVAANGTLQPTNKVDIGSELSGTVARVLVDVNDVVKKGQVLVELDTTRLRAQVERSRAALAVAQANLRQSQATVSESEGNLQRLKEVFRLSGGKVPSKTEMATAEATLARAQSAVASAQASVADARAAASSDETNLRKAYIRSPIDGVVLSRSVDPGNAVAASLQAVTLFTLAEDLTRMKLDVNVDEADVGLVHNGQKATFTVSAYPSRDYPAVITRVSYGSTTKDNVVTYVAELQVDNHDLTLRPGMSASASIIASERNNVLLVPNSALRFTPQVATQAAPDNGASIVSRLIARPRFGGPRRATTRIAAAREVWVLENGEPVSVPVVPGPSDGRRTEVGSTTLKPGMRVITEQQSSGDET